MESKILQSETPQERLQILKNNAEKRENFTYSRVLSEEELRKLKDDHAKEHIELARLNEQKKVYMDEFKANTKPIKSNIDLNLEKIRSRSEEVNEQVYLMADQEEGMMGYYNSRGELVYHRMLLPEERQFRIVDSSKNGTTDK